MNVKLLVTGLVLGLAAAVLSGLYIQREIARFKAEGSDHWVMVATQAVAEKSALYRGALKTIRLPEGIDPAALGAVPATDFPQVEGRGVTRRLDAGKILLWGHLAPLEAGRPEHLTHVIPKGKRAVTIPMDQSRGAGGWIRPGDSVDLLGTFQVPGPDGQTHPATFPFMQRVKVLATGGYTTTADLEGLAPRAYGDITVVVSSQEAQRLVFAIQNGTAITAVLRAPHDDAQEPAMPVRWETFLAAAGVSMPTTSP